MLHRLGADVRAIFLGGGVTGRVLDDLLARAGIPRQMIAIADDTRLSLTVVERPTGHEYRFVPEGPEVSAAEAQEALAAAGAVQCDYLVASGSLPRGLPEDFYAQVGRAAAAGGARFVLDTSGPPLKAALDAGGIFLVKPNRAEFESLAGRQLSNEEVGREAARLVEAGKAENVAVTLGQEGAILVDRGGIMVSPAVQVETRSAVGAGDSFVAGMVYGFATGPSGERALRLGLAAGAAAVLSSGSELAKAEDLERLFGAALSGKQVDGLGGGSEGG